MKCWKGSFQVPPPWTFLVSITGSRKLLSLIPGLFLFLWMSVRWPLTSPPPAVCLNDLSVTARGQIGSKLWRLITLISEEKTSAEPKPEPCWLHFLFPASDLKGKKPQPCFPAAQLVFAQEFCLSPAGVGLRPQRHTDVSVLLLIEMSHQHLSK